MKVTVCVTYFDTAGGGSTMLSKKIDLPVAPMVGDYLTLTAATADVSEWHAEIRTRYVGPDGVEVHCPAIGNRLDANAIQTLRDNGYS